MKGLVFTDLARQQERIRAQIERRLSAVLDRGDYIMGREITELEDCLCEITGAKYCITCASGSDGLLMASLALNLKKGDIAFIPAFSFFASAEMPILGGLTPVFVDIDPIYFQMDPQSLREAIRKAECRRGLILPVDLFGQPAPYDEILTIARESGLYTLEDAAQAFGASYSDRKVCNLGCDLAVTSFFPAKPLGCYGDGGAVFTSDPILAEAIKSIRIHGKGADKYDNIRIGINGRMDTLQAAILLAKLDIFADEIERRNALARKYSEKLADLPGVQVPAIMPGSTSVWAQYCILTDMDQRSHIQSCLSEKGIPTNIYYPTPLPFLKAFAYLNIPSDAFPVATNICKRILALPFHPYVTEEEIEYICNAIAVAVQ